MKLLIIFKAPQKFRVAIRQKKPEVCHERNLQSSFLKILRGSISEQKPCRGFLFFSAASLKFAAFLISISQKHKVDCKINLR